ncbi:MAG: VCBS repeat-containing protein [Planctomycetales bacterium]|nr:VCBS repeat-containing protein [Planctomycetales bacterium]
MSAIETLRRSPGVQHCSTRAMITIALTALLLSGCPRRTPPAPTEFQLTDELVAQHNQAVAEMGKFDYSAAFKILDALVTQHPNWTAAKIDREIARLNRRQGDDEKVASENLEQIVAEHPDELRALYCRAVLNFNNGESAAALERFRRVSQADPADAYAVYYTGQCLFDSGEFGQALEHFRQAQQIDPYLRSAYYGMAQALARNGQPEESRQAMETFLRLADNPQAHLAEVKYTRMGPKAELQPLTLRGDDSSPVLPDGDLFANAAALHIVSSAGESTTLPWRTWDATEVSRPSVTVCDINQDGQLDVFVAGGLDGTGGHHNAVILQKGSQYEWAEQHPLTKVTEVVAALWGDIDNDLFVDVYLCRRGRNQLWRHGHDNTWSDVTESTGTAGDDLNSAGGTMFDADHDGDLDIFVVNDNGPNELFSNNLDGTFRVLADEQQIAGEAQSRSRQVLVGDWDHDRDVDLIVLNQEGENEVYWNDRLWNYRPAEGWDAFRRATVWAAVALDVDVDGRTELVTLGPDGLIAWSSDSQGVWQSKAMTAELPSQPDAAWGWLALQDLTGNGRVEAIVGGTSGWVVCELPRGKALYHGHPQGPVVPALFNLDVARGSSILAVHSQDVPEIWRPGAGRFDFAQLAFSGKEDKANQMRSNAAGVGIQVAVRVGADWSTASTLRIDSSPGQSQQPVAVGLHGRKHIDYVSLLWPDGLVQSEVLLDAGSLHRITETQRQVSSCPVVFVWDGRSFQFVTDILGVGGIGFNVGRGEYGPPRPWENLQLPADLLKPRPNGHYEIRLGEPMEEAMYLDAARLVSYDLPPGFAMFLDERFATNDPQPTGLPVFYRQQSNPARVTNERGEDVTTAVTATDGVAAPIPPVDQRFIGRTETHELILEFDEPLSGAAGPLWLVFDGWVEYPYSQTMFAAWQAAATYDAPSLYAENANGQWELVHEQFGYMAGMPRRSAVPIVAERLPAGTRRLRLTTNVEAYWDRLFVVAAEVCPEAVRHEHRLVAARVTESGFAIRVPHPQRRPEYDYSQRVPLWDTRHQAGQYTRFGPALPLVANVDDAVAIIGPGEEVQLEFAAHHEPLPPHWTREFVLESNGWCKDRDLYTENGETLEPLPLRDAAATPSSEQRDQLHRELNDRVR